MHFGVCGAITWHHHGEFEAMKPTMKADDKGQPPFKTSDNFNQ
jgi:hypothetical protein